MLQTDSSKRDKKIHFFSDNSKQIPLPEVFTNPFCYTPHPLSVIAAQKVQQYIKSRSEWQQELKDGKMFGVLVIQTSQGELGYLAAFSGMLAGKNQHDFFVPPVYDLQTPDGFFLQEEKEISKINEKIRQMENSLAFLELTDQLAELKQTAQLETGIAQMRRQEAKFRREQYRQQHPEQKDTAEMIRESQFLKAEVKRVKERYSIKINELEQQLHSWNEQIRQLKTERKHRSATLQQKLFTQFKFLNIQGEVKNLFSIFQEAGKQIPPAGAGECAAPRLLQYAFQHQLRPIAMAEFWWGDSPHSEIRKHGNYYPACQGKCAPILKHMLKGLEIEKNSWENTETEYTPDIIWEDEWIIAVNKPAGMLSVPGKNNLPSIEQFLRQRYPEASGPIIVHRLDMDTSGILIAAKDKKTHQLLQEMFRKHTVKKRYIALIEGNIPDEQGLIDLPIRLDPENRPYQIVDPIHGKRAITQYEVLERHPDHTRIAFYPLTGRTHQLRVHSAHPLGLNCPIVGDPLYGQKKERLYLHAEQIEFIHPHTGKLIRLCEKTPF